MNAREALRSPSLGAAAAALLLLPLTGCTTSGMLGDWPHEMFGGISHAYLRPDELGIEYVTRAYRQRCQVAWFRLSELRKGPQPWPMLLPGREERTRGSPPDGAKPLPVGREKPSLPAGADIAVFVPPKGEELAHGGYGFNVAIVMLVGGDGQVHTLRPWLPTRSYRPWHRYPFVPLAIAWDVATFPLQLLFFSSLGH